MKQTSWPDWVRRGVRLAIALWMFTFTGATLWLLPDEDKAEWGDEVRQSCNWGAATCAVVAASPLIGKVVQLSGERTLGTVMGGSLGYVIYDHVYKNPLLPDELDVPILCTAAALVGLLSCWMSQRFKLDASMRLFVITFVLVTFGAHPEKGALQFALLRTGGIIVGVLVFMMLTVLVLPKSACIEAIRESQKCLKLLVDLNRVVAAFGHELDEQQDPASGPLQLKQGAPPLSPKQKQQRCQAQPLALLGRVAAAFGLKPAPRQGYQPLPGGGGGAADDRLADICIEDAIAHAGAAADPGAVTATAAAAPASAGAKAPASREANGRPAPSRGGSVFARSPAAVLSPEAPLAQPTSLQAATDRSQQLEEHEARFEKIMSDIYKSVFKLRDLIDLSRNELYIFHCWGHHIVLPLFGSGSYCACLKGGTWRPPVEGLDALSRSVRRLARLLYSLHLGYEDVIASDAPPAAGQLHFAPEMFGNLIMHLDGALRALAEEYPSNRQICIDSLRGFASAVDGLLDVSTACRAAVIEQLARSRPKPHRPMREREMTERAASLSLQRGRSGALDMPLRGAEADGDDGGDCGDGGGAVSFVTRQESFLPISMHDGPHQAPPTQSPWAGDHTGAGPGPGPTRGEWDVRSRTTPTSDLFTPGSPRPVQVSLLSAVLRRNTLAPAAGRGLHSAASTSSAQSAPPGAPDPLHRLAGPPVAASAAAEDTVWQSDADAAFGNSMFSFSAPTSKVGFEAWHMVSQQQQQNPPQQRTLPPQQLEPHQLQVLQPQLQPRVQPPQQHLVDAVAAALTSEVRFYAVQLVLDDMVEELEELYLAARRIMEGLPHGI